MIDMVVVNYRTPALLGRFLDSLAQYPPSETFSLVVVDVMPLSVGGWRVDHYVSTSENIGYNRACNIGAMVGTGDIIAFFNADTAFSNSHCVDRCAEVLRSSSEVGVVGPLQVNERGQVTHAGVYGSFSERKEEGWKSPNPHLFTEDKTALTVSGSAYFIKRSVWDELAGCSRAQDIDQGQGAFLQTDHYFGETWC